MNFVSKIKRGYGYNLLDYAGYLVENGRIEIDTYQDVFKELTNNENGYFKLKLMGDHTIELVESEQ